MTIEELRSKAAACHRKAAGTTGDTYHRLMQRAQALEAEANEREYYKTRMAEFRRSSQQHKGATHG
ncbi:hypothetical protein [Methylobacter tundripaludum]|uniref:hypothetical protein n=1 Tax=Methylobacter tundripaludum TaxID=173365 RepID=UPI0004DF2267|nr:hypothetical protein [Methylobacter tundripaludum]